MNTNPTDSQKVKSAQKKVPPTDAILQKTDPPALTQQGEVDKKEHYDIDGVSYEDDVGVIVASDASKVLEEKKQK